MSKTVITFGRMNPPTVGHQKLIDRVKSEAKKQGAMPHVYVSHSQDAKKNPLDYNTKFTIARKAFGPSVTRSRARTIIEVMQELEKMGHTEVTLVVGSDRVTEFKTLLNRYNGKDFKFDNIEVVSAGDRDPDSDDVSGMSASKMRAAAQSGDYDSFKKGTPPALSEKEKKAMYDKIRSAMGVNEEKEIEVDDEDFEFTDKELDVFIDMTDLDELDENTEIDEEFGLFMEDLDEARKPLTVQQRMKIARRMKRLAPRMKRLRAIRAKRMADPKRIERRARKAAIKLLRKRFAGKQGQNYASLSPSSKISVDRIIQKKMSMVGKISKRLLPKIRKAELERLKRARSGPKKESFDAQFENFFSEAVSPAQQAAIAIAKKESGKYDKDGKRIKEQLIWEEEEDEGTNSKLVTMLRQAFRDPVERMMVIRALKGQGKSLQNPKLRPFILKLLNRLLDATQADPSMFAKMRDKLRRMSQDDEKETNEAQDPDIKDREGTQPAKYHSGLKKSTKVARDRHFKKFADKDDSNPANYKPAPGDAGAETKPSQYTKKYKALYGEDFDAAFETFIAEQYIEEKALEGLKKKAEKSGISYATLKKVYDRGMAAWKSGHRPGTTPQQWAYARVNSYITKGKTYHTADSDLREEDIDEARRGRPRKNPLPTGQENDEGGLEHIQMQLRKSISLRGLKDVEFADGKKHKVKPNVAHAALNKIDRIKDRKQRHDAVVKIGKSLNDLMSFVNEAKSPLQRLIDFDKTRVAVGKKPIFKSNEKKPVKEQEAEKAARARIAREKEADKVKHDRMLDQARTRDTQAKNRISMRKESIDTEFENMLSEGFTAGISDTMYAMDFEEHKVQGGFEYHPSVLDEIKKRDPNWKAMQNIRKSGAAGSHVDKKKIIPRKEKYKTRYEEGGAGEEGTNNLVKKYKKDTPGEMCEAIEFMKKHDIDIVENIYRPLSEKYFEFFREARRMMHEGEIEFSSLDRQILETELGMFDWYEGMEVPLDCPLVAIEEEAEPELNKPKRGGAKKFYVYVRDPQTKNIKKVSFGDVGGSSTGATLRAKINDPQARKSFAARHSCDTANDKTTASYWSCRLPRYAKSLGLQVDNPGAWW